MVRIIDRYVLRELVGPFLLVFCSAILLMLLYRAIQLINRLAASGSDFRYFPSLMLQLLPNYANLALPLAFLISLMLLIARLDDRLELDAMISGGASLARLTVPLVLFGCVLLAISLTLHGWLEPAGRYNFRTLKAAAASSGEIGQLEPMAVYQPTDQLMLTYDRRMDDGSLEGLFVSTDKGDGSRMLLAGKLGQIGTLTDGAGIGIALKDGNSIRYQTSGKTESFQYGLLRLDQPLDRKPEMWERGKDHKELFLDELGVAMRDRDTRYSRSAVSAEFWSRIARAAILPLLPLFVVPLAIATKNGRRGPGLLLAALMLALAHNAMNLAKNLSASGGGSVAVTILPVFLLFAALCLLVFLTQLGLPSPTLLTRMNARIARSMGKLRESLRKRRSIGSATIRGYISRIHFISTLGALLSVVGYLVTIDLLERGDRFFERGVSAIGAAEYVFLRLPAVLQQAMPIAALTGVLIPLTQFVRHRETIAMRSFAISLMGIARALAPCTLVLMLGTFALSQVIAPTSEAHLARWWEANIEGGDRRGASEDASPRWFRVGGTIVRANWTPEEPENLLDVTIVERGTDLHLSEEIYASSATFDGHNWVLRNVERSTLGPSGLSVTKLESAQWPEGPKPGDLAQLDTERQAFSAAEARRIQGLRLPSTRSATEMRVWIAKALAAPLAPLVIILFALPTAALGPSEPAWRRFALAIGAGMVFMVVDSLLTAMAQAGHVGMFVGVWASPIFGIAIAVSLLLNLRQ